MKTIVINADPKIKQEIGKILKSAAKRYERLHDLFNLQKEK